jgi:uncharacterized OB-fold protein
MVETRRRVETHSERIASAGFGEIYSYTVVQEAPEGFEDQAPYIMALIKLDEGALVAAQLTDIDPDAVRIGERVEMVTRRLTTEGKRGMIIYGYKFRPLLKGG